MDNQRKPLQPGESAPAFSLPSVNREGAVSLDDLRGRAFLVGLYRGLHCPFCRRQVVQLAAAQPALRAAGVETLAVINTPLDRARLYFRHRPSPLTLLSDPDCAMHRAFGVPHITFLPEGSTEAPQWPYRASMADFLQARINPTGELDQPTFPLDANAPLNAKDGFEMAPVDETIAHTHGAQLSGHFLIDKDGIVRWARLEAPDDPSEISTFPTAAEMVAAAQELPA